MEFLIKVDGFFSVFLFQQTCIVLIYLGTNCQNGSKTNNSVDYIKIRFDDFRKNKTIKNSRGHFLELLYESLNRIWFM